MKIKDYPSNFVTFDSLPVGSIFKFVKINNPEEVLFEVEDKLNSIFIKIKRVKDNTTSYFYNCINLFDGCPFFLPTTDNALCVPYNKENFKLNFDSARISISNPLSVNNTSSTRQLSIKVLNLNNFGSLANGSIFTRFNSSTKTNESIDFNPLKSFFFIKVNEFKYTYSTLEYNCNALCLNFNDVNVRDGKNENFTSFTPDTTVINLNDICILDVGKQNIQ